jgi:peptide/nickel transport system substrate-binding protein
VKWHDGEPFSARDVECTWNLLLEKSTDSLRVNPRFTSYKNLDRVTTNGEWEVTFHLNRPQPAFLMLLAGGAAAVYPCHVPADIMRKHPIGTGPFKFVEYKPNEHIKVSRNPGYWKPGRPYLDGIEWMIVRNVGTAMLAFKAGEFDLTFPTQLTVPLMKDTKKQTPIAMCELTPGTVNRHVIINRTVPPFDNPSVRRALALAIDRQAFIDILGDGKGNVGAVLQPTPGGLWGMPPQLLKELPGYDPDVQKSRQNARAIMEERGYGPTKRLKVKISVRDLPQYRDAAIILLDQLREVYFDGELEMVETANYFPKIRRKEFIVGLNLQTSGPDPDPILDLFYGCGSSLNWDGYCNPEVDKLIEQQSMEADPGRRTQILWDIERKLGEEIARPIIFYADGATCWHPHVKNVTILVNSFFNGHRYEDAWLDR